MHFGLTLGGIGALANAVISQAGTAIYSGSPLTVAANVADTGGGNILLTALGNTPADNLDLNANVTASGGDGNILLVSGNSMNFSNGVTVSAGGIGTVTAVSGEDFTDGLLNQDGNTGSGGGSILMGSTSAVQTEQGDILMDAADNFSVGRVNADSDNADVRGNVTMVSRAGSMLDADTSSALNITADELIMTSAGTIGLSGDPIEIEARTINGVVVGAGAFDLLTVSVASLFAESLPLHQSQNEGRYAVDFPGYSNGDRFAKPLLTTIDTSQLDNVSIEDEMPAVIVPIPKPAVPTRRVVKEKRPAVAQPKQTPKPSQPLVLVRPSRQKQAPAQPPVVAPTADEKNPPTIVPIPKEAFPTRPFQAEKKN